MKIFKIILKTLFVLIFVCSVVLNILLFNSSYGKLIFKTDMSLIKSMSTNSFDIVSLDLINEKEESGFEYTLEVEENGKLVEKHEYKIYFDSEKVFHMSHTHIDKDEKEVTYYLTNDSLYINTGNSRNRKKLTSDQINQYKDDILTEISLMQEVGYGLPNSFTSKEIKSSLDFSLSPFYFLGIEVEFDSEEKDKADFTLHYDLNGILRKLESTYKEQYTKMTFSYDDSSIKFPDFKPYGLVHE